MTTIEKINKASGQETLHPLICVVSECADKCCRCKIDRSDYYALTIERHEGGEALHLSVPGEKPGELMDNGVYFHPDLLCETPLESRISAYPKKCRCHGNLSPEELSLINGCFIKIKEELNHPIDRHSAMILSSHLELLLNYCIRICN